MRHRKRSDTLTEHQDNQQIHKEDLYNRVIRHKTLYVQENKKY